MSQGTAEGQEQEVRAGSQGARCQSSTTQDHKETGYTWVRRGMRARAAEEAGFEIGLPKDLIQTGTAAILALPEGGKNTSSTPTRSLRRKRIRAGGTAEGTALDSTPVALK